MGKFTNIEGRVDVTSPGKTAVAANVGDPLQAGDIIRTKSKSKAEVAFIDGSILRLAANSRLRISEFSQDQGKRNAVLNLFRGKIQNTVQTIAGAGAELSKYEIHTPTSVCGVRGTAFYTYYQSGVSGTVVTEGTVYGYSTNKPDVVRLIGTNQTMIVTDPNLPPTIRTSTPAEAEQLHLDTTLAEKPKKEGKEEEDRKPETAATKTEGGQEEAGPREKQKQDVKSEEKTAAAGGDTEKIVAASAKAGVNESSGSGDLIPKDMPSATAVPGTGPSSPTTFTAVAQQTAPPTTPYVPPVPTDTKAPVITAATLPNKLANTNRATFIYNTDERATVKFQVDNQGWITGQALDMQFVITLPNLADGAHTISVQATDHAGNASPVTSYAWTVDATPPAITLTGTPPPLTNVRTANIQVSTSEQATSTYALNGMTVASPNLTNLPEGENTFIGTATDMAGNTSSQTYTWTTDYTPPTITLTGTPASFTNAHSAKIGVTVGEGALPAYALNGATVASPNLTNLPEGQNTFSVTATDAAGNTSTQTYTWTADYTPPRLALSGKPQALTNMSSPIFQTLSSETGTTFDYLLDGTPFAGSGDSISFTGLTEGSHTITVQGADGAGNKADSLFYFWTIDLTKPVVSLAPSSLPRKVTGDETTNFIFNAADTYLGDSYYRVDNGPWEPFYDRPLTIPEGERRIDFKADDLAGNVSDPSPETAYEWFIGKRQYVLRGAVAGGLNGVVLPSSEGIRAISNGNRGAWLLDMGGNYASLPAAFNLAAGGKGYGPNDPSLSTGYWLSLSSALPDGGSDTISGTSTFFFLSYSISGSGTGALSGSFTASAAAAGGTWQLQDLGLGTYQETPLAFSGSLSGEALRYDSPLNAMATSGILEGLTGGGASLFDGFNSTLNAYLPAPFQGLGIANNSSGYPLAGAVISGLDLAAPTANSYLALFGGRSGTEGSSMQGEIAGLYWKNIGGTTYETGIITSSLFGLSLHPGIDMWEITPGAELIARPIANDTTPPVFDVQSDMHNDLRIAATDLSGFQGTIALNSSASKDLSLTGRDWGVLLKAMGGGYEYGGLVNNVYTPLPLPAGSSWIWTMDATDAVRYGSYALEIAKGNEWEGKAGGVKIDWVSAKIYVLGETVKGLFNPIQATWQAIASGGWLETGKFRGLQATTAGRAALDALHIPAVLVGRTDLTGSGDFGTAGTLSVNMKDVAFFAYATGAPARIWATGADNGNPIIGGVSGSYTGTPLPGWTVPLTGSNYTNAAAINGNFVVNTWNNAAGGNWGARVTGGGMIGPDAGPSSVIFKGAAAGAIINVPNGAPGTFTGTGAGIVAPAQ